MLKGDMECVGLPYSIPESLHGEDGLGTRLTPLILCPHLQNINSDCSSLSGAVVKIKYREYV